MMSIRELSVVTLLSWSAWSCSSSPSEEEVGEWSETYASGFAIASLTAAVETAGAARFTAQVEASVDSSAPLEEKIAALDALAEGEGGCTFTPPTPGGLAGRANCFGKTVNYANHPDGSPASGQLPGGDLGLWEPSEPDGTACAASQMNALMSAVSAYVDISLAFQAVSVCILTKNEEGIPEDDGDSITFTDDLSDAIEAQPQGPTITSAKVKRIASDHYEYTFIGTSDGAKPFEITISHKADNSDNTDFSGRINGYWASQNTDAFSVDYVKDGDDVQAQMIAGSWMDVDTDELFDDGGKLKFADDFHGNMNHVVINQNTDTGVGSVSYAWQAGAGDDKTRVFNVYTSQSGDDVSGCGFFGYGPAFSITESENENDISGFICNWAGPGNDHSMSTTSGKSQKQCFAKNSSGIFALDSTKNNITYAPTVSCNDTTSLTYDWPTGSGDGATNNLVTLSTDTEFSSYSAPSLPVLGSDFD